MSFSKFLIGFCYIYFNLYSMWYASKNSMFIAGYNILLQKYFQVCLIHSFV